MKKRLLVSLLLAAVTPAAAEKRKITVDDLMRLRSLSDVRIAPDGERVAYVVSEPSFEEDAHVPTLYVVSSRGGAPRRMTYRTPIWNRPLPAPALRWSPDGRSLSFLAVVDNAPQVAVLDANGGEPRIVTAIPDGISSYEWSPDGRRIAFLAPEPPSKEEERKKAEKSYVIEVGRSERPIRLWVQDLEDGGRPIPLTPLEQSVSELDWSPDGALVAYSWSPKNDFYGQYQSRIFVVPSEGGEPRAVVDRAGMNAGPRYSPDGRFLAFLSTDGRAEMISIVGLHVVSSSGGAVRNLSARSEAWVGELAWAADSSSIFYIPHEGTGQRGANMFEQAMYRVSIETGESEVVTPGPQVNFSPSLSRDGRRLAFRSVRGRSMGDAYVIDLETGESTQVTEVNPQLSELQLGTLEPVSWRSFDGAEIWGLLLTPPSRVEGKHIPLVVYLHGGPIGGVTYGIFPQFMHRVGQVDPYPTEALAASGIAVLFPMPRGGSGYGLEGFRKIVNGWGDVDYRDILAGIDHLIAEGLADPERLGVMGGSYGGFMTNWIVTQTDRFRAASAMCSISDIESLFYLSDAGDFTVEYFGLPWENRDVYAARSPLTHARNVKTPLLLQHGENDRRVPVEQARKFYKALEMLDKNVELEIYPRGGHVLYEPDLEREIMRRNLEWFVRWLEP